MKEVNVLNEKTDSASSRFGRLLLAALATAVLAGLLALAGCSAPVEKSSVSDYSWAELSQIATEIREAETDADGIEIASAYHLLDASGKTDGKTVGVSLSDGTKASVVLAGVRQDDLADGGKAGLTFVFADAVAAHAMEEDASNDGGWEKSAMRSWLNADFMDKLPSDLKGVIKAASKKTDSSAYTTPGAVASTSDKLWLLSYAEAAGSMAPNDLVGGSGIPAETYNREGVQYQLFADKKVSGGQENAALERVFDGAEGNGIVMPGESCPWWLRSLSMTQTSGFASVDADGDPLSAWIADHDIGVVPGFCL